MTEKSIYEQAKVTDKPGEECGVFGMYDFDGSDVSGSIYYGLLALQHRGQESCGIAVSDTSGPKGKVLSVKDMGLVNEAFNPENLEKLLLRGFPQMKHTWVEQFSALFGDLRHKCDSSEISTKALDLRGLLSALHLMEKGIPSGQALELGIINKAFDPFERKLVEDVVTSRIPADLGRDGLFA